MKATSASVAFHSWQSLPSWPEKARPRTLWPYLSEAGSLTELLKTKAGTTFHVRVLNEEETPLLPQDAALLYAKTGIPAYLRQVYLCGREPLVYARSVAVGEGIKWVRGLGESPLGARVFAETGACRGPIEMNRLTRGEPLHDAAVAGLTCVPNELWARRSLLTVGTAAILIYECFLPALER